MFKFLIKFVLIFLIILKGQSLFSEEKNCNRVCKSIIALSFSFVLDEKLREENLNFSNSFKERTIKIFEPLGRRSFGFYLSSVSLFLGFTKKDKSYNFLALELIEANLISDLSSNLLQKDFGRIRPQKSGGDSHLFFKGGNSFPSSHSIHSWAWASVLSFKYPKYKYYFFSLSSLVSLSRVLDDKHWLSDVVFGSIVGYAIGKFTYKFNEEKTNFFIFPFYERKSFGILISLPSGISNFF